MKTVAIATHGALALGSPDDRMLAAALVRLALSLAPAAAERLASRLIDLWAQGERG